MNVKKPMSCNFCNTKQDVRIFCISKLLVVLKKNTMEVGMLTLLKELNRYTLERCYHLSASEIILLRPDLLVDFLTLHYGEPIISYSFVEHRICENCFEKYKKLVPEK